MARWSCVASVSSSLQSAFNAALLTVEFESKKADLLSRM